MHALSCWSANLQGCQYLLAPVTVSSRITHRRSLLGLRYTRDLAHSYYNHGIDNLNHHRIDECTLSTVCLFPCLSRLTVIRSMTELSSVVAVKGCQDRRLPIQRQASSDRHCRNSEKQGSRKLCVDTVNMETIPLYCQTSRHACLGDACADECIYCLDG